MIRLIFPRKCLINLNLNQSMNHLNFLKLSIVNFSKKSKFKKRDNFSQSKTEEKKNLSDDENIEIEVDNKVEEKSSLKDKFSQFFSFAKSKATYTFADTTKGKELSDDEKENFKLNESIDNEKYIRKPQIKKSNEFMKFMINEEKLSNTKEEEKVVEEIVIKSSYQLFKDYLNVSNDHSIVKEAFSNKDFERDIKPLMDKYISELNFTKSYLKLIFLNHPKFFTQESTWRNLTKIREFLINRFSYTSAEVAEIITSKTIIIDYPTEEIDNNISFLKSFLKVDETEVKRLIFENPFLLIAKENKYKDVNRYMKLFLDIKDDDFITIAKKLPLILRTDPIKVVSILRETTRYKTISKEKWIQCFINDPSILVLKPLNLRTVFGCFSHIGFKSKDTMDFILKYPEFMIANRFEFVFLKLKLLRTLGLAPASIKKFINKYPFVILKSYNSFVRKVNYYRNTFDTKIENEEIFPFIFLFNLKRDIIPRLEIIKKYDRNFNLTTAFELSPEEFVKQIGANMDEFNLHYKDGFPLYERDILFRYDKFKI